MTESVRVKANYTGFASQRMSLLFLLKWLLYVLPVGVPSQQEDREGNPAFRCRTAVQ